MTDSVYWIWLQLVFGIGTRRAELMMNYFEHPKTIWDELQSGDRAASMLESRELEACGKALERAEELHLATRRKGCRVVTPDDSAYPALLRGIDSKPAALYVKGELECLSRGLCVAMVGTRHHTEYGKRAAIAIGGKLAGSGAVVVSGLASGIDSDSHQAALSAGGKTVGILGCGIDVDYPKGSAALKRAVCENGAIVTEFPLGTKPYQSNFPLRNRVVSGVSHGTVVVEADLRSGSLITARMAREQGRQLFAVPGSIFAQGVEGTHQLIKQGARLVESGEDILRQFSHVAKVERGSGHGVRLETGEPPAPGSGPERQTDPEGRTPPAKKPAPGKKRAEPAAAPKELPEGVSREAAAVYERFGAETLTVDALITGTGLAAGHVLSALTELEIYGMIQSHPGRRFGLR